MPGGKSRKSGGVSANLIAQLTKSKPGIAGKPCGGNKPDKGEGGLALGISNSIETIRSES